VAKYMKEMSDFRLKQLFLHNKAGSKFFFIRNGDDHDTVKRSKLRRIDQVGTIFLDFRAKPSRKEIVEVRKIFFLRLRNHVFLVKYFLIKVFFAF